MRPPIDSATILITGASSGIGRELARQLSWRARTLVLVARRSDRLEELRQELQARNPTLGLLIKQCDLAQASQVEALLGSLERHLVNVDVLVNNAGAGSWGLFEEQGWSELQHLLQVSVVAPVLLAHRLVRRMVERRRGGILNISSGAGQLIVPGKAVYAASKRFLDGFSEALRQELAGAGVVVTQVAPGPVASEPDTVEGLEGEGRRGLLRISPAQCAREALEGFERGEALVYPGRAYRWLMDLLPLVPRPVQRAAGRWVAHSLRQRAPLLEAPASPALPVGLSR